MSPFLVRVNLMSGRPRIFVSLRHSCPRPLMFRPHSFNSACLQMLLSSLSIVFLTKRSLFRAILYFIDSMPPSQCITALGVVGGSLVSFLRNLSWKFCKSLIWAWVIPIQLSLLNRSPGMIWASNSLIAVSKFPVAPITGSSAIWISSSPFLFSL